MPDTEVEQEFKSVKERRGGGITQTIKNTPTLIFLLIIGLIILFFWMVKDSSQNNKQLLIIALAIVSFVFFFQKKSDATGLISEEVAKRIAVETIENKKEDFHITSDTDITPTSYCVLQYRQGEPFKWHVGMKIENRDGKIDYWRVIIHPYDGIVIGIVREPTGFEGRESEVRDVLIIYPGHYMEE